LIQDKPCRVYYPYYEGLMENQAVELIGRKQQAASLLYGEGNGGGLSALNGNDGGNLLAALAAEIDGDASVTDLRDLFAKHANETDPAESAWFAVEEDVIQEPAAMQSMLEVMVVSSADSLIKFLTQERGGGVTAIPPTPVAPVPRKRRHRLDLSAAPDGPAVKNPLSRIPVISPVAQEVVQLALF